MLVTKNTIPKETKEFLDSQLIDTTYVIGGSQVISEEVFNQLENAVRIAGKNRYETAVEVVKKFGTKESLLVASGENFRDALSGANLATELSANMLLVRSKQVPSVTEEFITDKSTNFQDIFILGGPVAINNETAWRLEGLLGK